MSLVVIRAYAEVAILLACGLLLFWMARVVAETLGGRQPARRWLHLAQALVVLALALPPGARVVIQPDDYFRAPMQVEAQPSPSGTHIALTLSAPSETPTAPLAVNSVLLAAVAYALFAASALGLALLVRDARRLRALCRRAVLIKRVGRVSILVSSEIAVPFSTAVGRRAYVVLPEAFVLSPEHFHLALTHEIAHLRARDVVWAQAMAVLAAFMPWNPAIYAWTRTLAQLRELACDERVIARRNVSAHDYGACLLWAAELARGARARHPLTVPMLARSRSFLERRITMIVSPKKEVRSFWMALVSVPVIAIMALTAAVTHASVGDRRITVAQAQAIADDLQRSSGFRVSVDEAVVEEMNRFLATAESRASLKDGLFRLASYKAVGEAALNKHGVPPVLLAIPLTESRIQPLPVDRAHVTVHRADNDGSRDGAGRPASMA